MPQRRNAGSGRDVAGHGEAREKTTDGLLILTSDSRLLCSLSYRSNFGFLPLFFLYVPSAMTL
jgi:hypothetical protein